MAKRDGFSTGIFFHRNSFPFKRKMWKKKVYELYKNGARQTPLMPVVDIGFDLLHRLGKRGILLHLLFDLLQRIEYRGVIPVVEYLADFHHRQIGHAADQIHGDLPGRPRRPLPAAGRR